MRWLKTLLGCKIMGHYMIPYRYESKSSYTIEKCARCGIYGDIIKIEADNLKKINGI